jgi:hypothetical protein
MSAGGTTIHERRTSGALFSGRRSLPPPPPPPTGHGTASVVAERLDELDGPVSDLPWPSPSYKGAGHLFFFVR